MNYPEPYQFRPNAPITQAEYATLIYQGLIATGKAAPVESEYIVQVDPTPDRSNWLEFFRRIPNNLITMVINRFKELIGSN